LSFYDLEFFYHQCFELIHISVQIIQKSEYIRSKGFVLRIVCILDELFFDESPEALDKVKVWRIWGQEHDMKSGVLFQPLGDNFGFEVLGVIKDKDDLWCKAVTL
jgi:hypothetical protein